MTEPATQARPGQDDVVLVVDDEPEVASVVAETLEAEGLDVAVAHTGREARACLAGRPVVLVLLDLHLPDVDGLALLQEIRTREAPPDIVVVTGHASVQSAMDAMDAGAGGYIEKPVDVKRLRQIVARSLARRRLLRDNEALVAQLDGRRRQAEALYEISTTLASTLDFAEALRRLCREFARLFGADTVSAQLHDPEQDLLIPIAAYRVPKEYLADLASLGLPHRGQPFYRPLIEGQRVVASDDVPHDARFAYEAFHRFPHQSGALLPLVIDGDMAGAFYLVWWRERRVFSAEELRLAAQICDQVSLFVRNARLFERAERDRRRIQTLLEQTERARSEAAQLYDVSRQLASSSALDEILDLITRTTVEVLGGDAAAIFEFDETRGLLVVRRSINLDARHVAGLVLRPGESVVGRAFVERQPVWVRDRLATPVAYAEQQASEAIQYAPRAFLGVPIVAGGEVCGVITLYHREPHDFTPGETGLLSTLASNAAVAIEKARLFVEIERQRHQLAGIFDSTSDGMLLVGRDGQIVSANRRAGELLAFDPAAPGVIGLTGVLASHYPDAAGAHAAVDPLRAAIEGGGDAEGDLELPGSGHTLHWVVRPASALTEASSVTLTDVTQEREVSRMKSDFVSFVTHQLRTPLAGIKWMLELANGAMPAADEATSFVNDAREAAERLIRLVNELLDVSRLESGRVVVTPTVVDLAELTAEVLADLTLLVKEKRHRLTVEAVPVPSVVVDRQLLRQVVINLLSNAIKYTPEAGTITVRIAAGDERVTWSVEDTGIGIPAEAQARLFEKFYRAENSVAVETEGTGLGLYLSKLIVERCGGYVWCDSAEGAGSTFGFALPSPR